MAAIVLATGPFAGVSARPPKVVPSDDRGHVVDAISPRLFAAVAIALLSVSAVASAQTDEIQVYDGTLTEPGKINLTLHDNYTPNGLRQPAFPGAIVSDKSFNGVPEWALGVTRWFEVGLYLPLYSVSKNLGATFDGFKLRALFAVPDADDRRFFYGVNFEFSVNATHWDPSRVTSEVRPIVGWRLHRVDIIVNPILDTAYDGLDNLDFAPATRVACNLSPRWAMAVEEYADFGPLRRFRPAARQGHQIYAVVDHRSSLVDVEAGVGFGLTGASDHLTLKLMFSRDIK